MDFQADCMELSVPNLLDHYNKKDKMTGGTCGTWHSRTGPTPAHVMLCNNHCDSKVLKWTPIKVFGHLTQALAQSEG